ncbi:MAG TPA: right-handed parallel beta-helix repeat-containing protein [Capsulimonadaceae bacterium]
MPVTVAALLAFASLPASASTIGDPAHPELLQSAITDAIAGGAKHITVTPGKYMLGTPGLKLVGLRDVMIDAYKVELVSQDYNNDTITFKYCTNVTFRGATAHCASPQTGQGRIVSIGADAGGSYYQVKLDDGYPRNADFKIAYFMDPVTKKMKAGTDAFHAKSVVAEATPGLVKVYRNAPANVAPNPFIAIGDYLVCRGPGRMMFSVGECSNCTFQDITIYWGSLFGFIDTRGDGANRYIHDTITYGPPPPGGTAVPMLSQTADGLHSAGTKIGPLVKDCTFEGMPDDAIAVHGNFDKIYQCTGYKLVVSMYRDIYTQFRAGEPVRLSDDATSRFEEAMVTAVSPSDYLSPADPAKPDSKPGKCVEITLDHPVTFPAGALASNPSRCGAGYKLIGNTIRNHMARGMLLKADNGLVENNTIDGSTIAAIVVLPQPSWGEGGFSRNVVIRRNTIRNTGYAMTGPKSGYPGAITVAGNGNMANENITIEENRFEGLTLDAISVADTKNVKIRGNTMIDCFRSPSIPGAIASERGADPTALIWIANCDGVSISKNTARNMGEFGKRGVAVAATAKNVTGVDDGVTFQKR